MLVNLSKQIESNICKNTFDLTDTAFPSAMNIDILLFDAEKLKYFQCYDIELLSHLLFCLKLRI